RKRRPEHEIYDVGEGEQALGGRPAAGRGGRRRGDEVQGGAQGGRRAAGRGGAAPDHGGHAHPHLRRQGHRDRRPVRGDERGHRRLLAHPRGLQSRGDGGGEAGARLVVPRRGGGG